MAAGGTWTEGFFEQAVQSALAWAKNTPLTRSTRTGGGTERPPVPRTTTGARLDKRFELLLKIAALLHEVGCSLATAAPQTLDVYHHEHDLFGLTRKDISLIALWPVTIAAPRRVPITKNTPHSTATAASLWRRWPRMLRCGYDALDRDHMQQVRAMTFWPLRARPISSFPSAIRADLTLERLALKEKGQPVREQSLG